MSENFEAIIKQLDEKICTDSFVNSEAFLKRLEASQKAGILFGDRPISTFLRPHFLARSFYDKVTRAAEILSSAFENLVEIALQGDAVLREFALTEREEKMARISPKYKRLSVSSRLDAFCHKNDFKFLEYNGETPAGVADQMSIEKSVETVPPVREFLAKNPHWKPQPHVKLLDALVSCYRDFGGEKAKPNIGVIDWEGVESITEFELLKDFFESQGFPTLIANPYQLEYDGKILRVGDFEIDIFYKRLIIHEFLEKFDDSHPIVRAYTDGNLCLANSFRSKIAHKKSSFAILSDEKYEKFFTAQQLEIIQKHIPWTRRLCEAETVYQNREIDLVEFLRKNREKFLIKPIDDYGGKNITLGWETSEGGWETALSDALQNSFVVQERVPVEKISIPTLVENHVEMRELLVDFDPFLFDGKVEGGLARLSSQSLVNVTQGGGETELVILEDW